MNPTTRSHVTDQPDPATDAGVTGVSPVVNATEVHRTKQRRLLFAIEVTLFGLVLLLGGGGQAGFVVAIFGLLIGLSGL
jgi:hypothetical protein